MDLVEFLRARLDEDEKIALGVSDGPNKPEHWTREEYQDNSGSRRWRARGQFSIAADRLFASDSKHIARHDPARVLRDVEAGRRLIEQYEAMRAGAEAAAGTILAGAAKVRLGAYEFALECRALSFADHPDYRPEWRP